MLYSKFRKVPLRASAAALMAILLMSGFAPTYTINSGERNSEFAYAASKADKAIDDKTYHIVAVGDSVTAGYERGYTEQSVPYGYVEHVYEQALFHGLRAEYANYGVLGLRTAGLRRWMDAVVKGTVVQSSDIQRSLPDPRADRIFAETKLLRSALSRADLIVMTIGGNDMYSVLTTLEEGASQDEAAAVQGNALNTYEAELEAALRLMLSLQPDAEVVIADQYLPIPQPVKIGALTFPLYPEADRLFLQNSVKQLRESLNQVTGRLTKDGFHLKIANVASSFIDKEVSFTSIAQGDIHPSRAGYAAMGKAYALAIWGDYLVVKPRERGVPVTIVVKGKELVSANIPILVQNQTYVPLRSITNVAPLLSGTPPRRPPP